MKSLISIAALSIALAACSGEAGETNVAGGAFDESSVTVTTPVEAPADGDWTKVAAATSAGGMLMGNPDAEVKLIEFASLTCHFCADFETENGERLANEYVKNGSVSWEYRPYVRETVDLTATLIARCGGPESFWGMNHGLFSSQQSWTDKVRNLTQADYAQIQQMAPSDMFKRYAEVAGLYDFAALRGLSRERVDVCLSDEAEANRLVDNTAVASNSYDIPGTPTFVVNGKEVDMPPGKEPWEMLKPALDAALAD